MDIDFIRQLVRQKRYTLLRHSDTRRARRSVPLEEIEAAILGGIITQKYPGHQPFQTFSFPKRKSLIKKKKKRNASNVEMRHSLYCNYSASHRSCLRRKLRGKMDDYCNCYAWKNQTKQNKGVNS